MALTRGCDASLLSALGGHFYPCLMTYADWPDGAVRLHSGRGTLSFGGQNWEGLGRFVQWSVPEESNGLATSEATVKIAATLEAMISERSKIIRNRDVSLYFGATTEVGGNVLIGDAVLIFTGYFDSRGFVFERSDEDGINDLSLGLGVGPSARSTASITHGPEDQSTKFPGDTFGRHFINAEKELFNPPVWPEV
jgi:hypothetical protein